MVSAARVVPGRLTACCLDGMHQRPRNPAPCALWWNHFGFELLCDRMMAAGGGGAARHPA